MPSRLPTPPELPPAPGARRDRTHWPVVLGPPVVMLLFAGGALYGLGEVTAARRQVTHTRNVLDALADVRTAVAEADAGQRGVLRTGDSAARRPAARAAARAGLARLSALTTDNAAQQARLAALARLTAERFARQDSAAAREVAAARAAPSTSDAPDDTARALLGAVRGEELRLLAVRQAREDRLGYLARGGIVLGAFAAALLSVLADTLLARHARRQAAQAAALGEQNQQLQQQAAELEVQQLTLQDQAAELEAQNEALQQQASELEQQQGQLQEQATELEAQAKQLAEQNAELGRAAERLTAGEAHARLLVDTVPSGLVESDAEGRFVWANPAAARILRLPRDEITTRDYAAPAWRTVTLDGAPMPPDALPVGRALATGEPVRGVEHAILDPATGDRVALRVNVTPLRDAAGRVTGALSAFDDVTAELTAQARLRRVAESGVVGLFSWTIAGGIVDANDAFLGMLGYTRADLAAGRVDWRRMTPPEYAAADEVAVAELMATGTHGAVRKAYVGRDGRAVPIVIASAFLPGSREEGVCVCLDLRALADVEAAERRAREGAERLLAVTAGFSGALTPAEVAEVLAARGAAAAGATAAAVLLVARDGKPPNGPFEGLPSEAPAPELELLAASGLGAAEAAAWARVPLAAPLPAAEAARGGRAVWLPDPAARAAAYPALAAGAGDDARRAWCALPLAARAPGGQPTGTPDDPAAAPPRVLGAVVFAFAQPQPFDVHQRLLLAGLADQAAQALERARLYREARLGNEAKSGFMATMSHELRTPLNALIGYSELLLMGVPDAIPPGAQAQVLRMRTAARHLLGLIEEVLLHARLDAGRVVVRAERVDADALVDEVRTVVEPLAEAKGLTLVVDAGEVRRSGGRRDGDPPAPPGRPVVLDTDPGKLRQILINLAGNAVKFTDRGAVTLRVRAGGGRVTFEVEDTGVGIAPDDHERVFEAFWQVAQHRGAQRPAGTGLGLSVTRRLARLLGGDVRVESALGAGSRFTVWVPAAPPAAPPGAGTGAA